MDSNTNKDEYKVASITASSKNDIDSLESKLCDELKKHIALVAYETKES